MEKRIYTVSSLTREIKTFLETNFPRLWVEGEVSNFRHHSSGHLYFTIKDENAQVRCVMWRFKAGKLLFKLEDGMKVLLEGDLQVYEKSGNYQLIVQQIQPAGIGELQLAFEQLKKRLHAEGLFDERHKKVLPAFPESIGVITSPTGAAIRDIISVITRRFPSAKIILLPVKVQGEGSAQEIVEAINDFNDYGKVDVLIVGRGGGSLEDMWSFNDETVARAIFKSKIPIVSAVGHEVDFTIADFVADHRAPTPSSAGEMVVPDLREVRGVLAYYGEKLGSTIKQNLQGYREILEAKKSSYAFRRPEDVLYQKIQNLDDITRLIQRAGNYLLELNRQQLENRKQRLKALSPMDVLHRGYSICYKDGEIIKEAGQVKALDMVQIRLSRGQFISQVQMLGDSE